MFEKKTKLGKEERREMALGGGTEHEYIICPLCGFNRVAERANFSVDLESHRIIQRRVSAGGKGTGGFYDTGEGMTLQELKESGSFEEIVENIKGQCKRILEVLK